MKLIRTFMRFLRSLSCGHWIVIVAFSTGFIFLGIGVGRASDSNETISLSESLIAAGAALVSTAALIFALVQSHEAQATAEANQQAIQQVVGALGQQVELAKEHNATMTSVAGHLQQLAKESTANERLRSESLQREQFNAAIRELRELESKGERLLYILRASGPQVVEHRGLAALRGGYESGRDNSLFRTSPMNVGKDPIDKLEYEFLNNWVPMFRNSVANQSAGMYIAVPRWMPNEIADLARELVLATNELSNSLSNFRATVKQAHEPNSSFRTTLTVQGSHVAIDQCLNYIGSLGHSIPTGMAVAAKLGLDLSSRSRTEDHRNGYSIHC